MDFKKGVQSSLSRLAELAVSQYIRAHSHQQTFRDKNLLQPVFWYRSDLGSLQKYHKHPFGRHFNAKVASNSLSRIACLAVSFALFLDVWQKSLTIVSVEHAFSI
jgi:hypothetical protein